MDECTGWSRREQLYREGTFSARSGGVEREKVISEPPSGDMPELVPEVA
jgi:hypothetical protein